MRDADGKHPTALFLTNCCARPICPTCLAHNPRLARYDPCLACLGGVRAVGTAQSAAEAPRNINAAVRDEDVYAIGDDEDEDFDPGQVATGSSDSSDNTPAPSTPPPPYASQLTTEDSGSPTLLHSTASSQGNDTNEKEEESTASRYYIRKGDTLLGIALRHGVDVRNGQSYLLSRRLTFA